MSLNSVVLMGRLCSDPELKTTQSGVSVTSFNIAVDRSYVKQGEERKTDFFTIICWRSTAEFVCKYFRKGYLIALEGQLQSRTYQDKSGNNRTVVEVVTDQVSFTGEKHDSSPNVYYSAPPQPTQQSYQQPTQNYQQPPQQQNFADMPIDDDLPF
jgi:single-strand DNA-binding protein